MGRNMNKEGKLGKYKNARNSGYNFHDSKRALDYKEVGQEYAQVVSLLGNCRCQVMCMDNKTRLCRIRGAMYKKVWISAGDIILVGLRDYQDDKCDAILKYTPNEARKLKGYGELPDNITINEGIQIDLLDDNLGGYFVFQDDDTDQI